MAKPSPAVQTAFPEALDQSASDMIKALTTAYNRGRQGKITQEIAEITGVNENTVWTRLRAARRIFQEGVARQFA